MVLGVVLASVCSAETLYVEGTQELNFRLPRHTKFLPEHRAVGYHQAPVAEGDQRSVRIEVTANLIHGRTPRNRELRLEHLTEEERLSPEAVQALTGIVRQSQSNADVVDAILSWIAETIQPVRRSPGTIETAMSTMEVQRASCVGRSHLAAGMLKAMGLEVRYVHGALLEDTRPQNRRSQAGTGGSSLGPVTFHRWIEVKLPEAGWIPCDPGVSHGFVGANYITLWTSPNGTDAPDRPFPDMEKLGVEVIAFQDRLLHVDRREAPEDRSVASIKFFPSQYTTAVYGLGPRAVTVGLERIGDLPQRRDKARFSQPSRGKFAFFDVPAGEYRLTWRRGGGAPRIVDTLRLKDGTAVRRDIVPPTPTPEQPPSPGGSW